MIKKYDYNCTKIGLFFFFYRFYKNVLLNFFFTKNFIKKINKRKNLFFKKKESKETLISKRLSIVLKKRKKLKLFKSKKIDKGNFFLKKFFFKVLIKNRKFLKKLFCLGNTKKQLKVTRKINAYSKIINNGYTTFFEYSLWNLLLRSGLFFFHKDVVSFIKSGSVYVNNFTVFDQNLILNQGDIIQLPVSKYYYKYLIFSKKILKKKISLFRFTTWKFFKKKFLKKKQGFRTKKRKNPKYLHLFCHFKLNTPRFLETDFSTLSVCVLKKQNTNIQPVYYINKPFSYKLFPLYNFKKIN